MSRLVDVFDALPLPVSDRVLPSFSTKVLGSGPHRIGKDREGSAALLVVASQGMQRQAPAPIELEHIQVSYHLKCILWHAPGVQEEATFTIVRCNTSDTGLRRYFLSVLEGVLPLLGPNPTELEVRKVVDDLVELFSLLGTPPRKSIQGLWAELFVIQEATNALGMIEAWHPAPDESYDFTSPGQRIDVKSVSGLQRKHYFTYEQLHPPMGTETLIASLFVERMGGGLSVGELVKAIRAKVALKHELLLKVEKIVAGSLGEKWQNALEVRFDPDRALESLLFYDVNSIPSIGPDLPAGVNDVRFSVDLAYAKPAEVARLRSAGGLFQMAAPVRAPRR